MSKITIYQFTDPVCVWCWGNEPVLRAIDYLYGDKVDVEFIMGGLVEDIATLFETGATDGDPIGRANERLRRNWAEASQRHGMPVRTEPFVLFSSSQTSSFPQNIAYEAAKRQDPAAAKLFLRRMREATFAEARPTAQTDVLIGLAAETGLDVTEFVNEYTYGNAQADFMQDRTRCRRNGITGFPSYLIKSDQTSIILGGYQNLATFHTVIRRLSDGKIKPRKAGPSPANVMEFIKRYRTVYPVEIETAFGIDRSQTDELIDELIRSGRISAEAIGDGRRLTAAPKNTSAAKTGRGTAAKKNGSAKAQNATDRKRTAAPEKNSPAEKASGSSPARTARKAEVTAKKQGAKRGDTADGRRTEVPVTSEA